MDENLMKMCLCYLYVYQLIDAREVKVVKEVKRSDIL